MSWGGGDRALLACRSSQTSVSSRFTERSCLKNIRRNMIEANTCHWALPSTHKSIRMPGGSRTERCLWQLTLTVVQRCDGIWMKGRGERSCPHNFKKRKHFNCKIQAMTIHRIRHKQQTLVGKFASHTDTKKDGDTWMRVYDTYMLYRC